MEKHVVDRPPNEGTKVEEFAVDAMKRCLQKIALSRILGVEQLEQIEYERLIDVTFCDAGVEILAFDEP